MNTTRKLISSAIALLVALPAAAQDVKTENVDIHVTDSHLIVTADLILDNLTLKSNRQVLITPVVRGSEASQSSAFSLQRIRATGNGKRKTQN